jgi:hypothetical protein
MLLEFDRLASKKNELSKRKPAKEQSIRYKKTKNLFGIKKRKEI